MNRVYGPATTQRRLSACLASILEIEPGAVPTFEKVEPGDLAASVAEFVRPLGLAYVELAFTPDNAVWQNVSPLGFWIFRGPSNRGDFIDSVVVLGDRLAHDPGNGGEALAPIADIFDGRNIDGWRIGLFIPFDPLRVRRHEKAKGV